MEKKVVKLILISICATLFSIVLGLVAGMFIPTQVSDDTVLIKGTDVVKNGPYTEKEVKEVRKALDKKIERIRNQEKGQSSIQRYTKLRSAAHWVSWFPWLVVPFLLKLQDYRKGSLILALPLLLTIFKIFLPIEFFLFLITVVCSVFLAKALRRNAT